MPEFRKLNGTPALLQISMQRLSTSKSDIFYVYSLTSRRSAGKCRLIIEKVLLQQQNYKGVPIISVKDTVNLVDASLWRRYSKWKFHSLKLQMTIIIIVIA